MPRDLVTSSLLLYTAVLLLSALLKQRFISTGKGRRRVHVRMLVAFNIRIAAARGVRCLHISLNDSATCGILMRKNISNQSSIPVTQHGGRFAGTHSEHSQPCT